MAHEAGLHSFKHFLESYGLKIWNEDDVEEGKAILHAFHKNGRHIDHSKMNHIWNPKMEKLVTLSAGGRKLER